MVLPEFSAMAELLDAKETAFLGVSSKIAPSMPITTTPPIEATSATELSPD